MSTLPVITREQRRFILDRLDELEPLVSGHEWLDDFAEMRRSLGVDEFGVLPDEAPAPPVDAPSVDEVVNAVAGSMNPDVGEMPILVDPDRLRAFLRALGPEGLARGMANLNTEGK